MRKNILITGCSSGIGLAAASDLAVRGYRVLAACRKKSDVVRMEMLGFCGIQLDLNDEDNVYKAAEQVIKLTNNRLYALFNNAGYGVYGVLESISRQQLEQQFASNLFGTHQLTMLLIPALRANGQARIIITSSIMGLISMPGRGAYAASKYALEAWSDALRMELHNSGVQVSLIEPGPIRTCFVENVKQTQPDSFVKNPRIAARFTLPPEAILPKLHHALESSRPHQRYLVTLVAHIMYYLRHLLPGSLLDLLLRSNSRINSA